MADALLASVVVNSLIKSRKERYGDFEEEDAYYTEQPTASPASSFFGVSTSKRSPLAFDWFSFLVSTLISVVAIYLSWTCNTALGYGTTEKVLYAAGAGIFGVLYLFFFVLFRSDTCRAAMK